MMVASCVKLAILSAMLVMVVNHVSSNAYTAIQLPSAIFVLVATFSQMVDAGLVLPTVKSASMSFSVKYVSLGIYFRNPHVWKFA